MTIPPNESDIEFGPLDRTLRDEAIPFDRQAVDGWAESHGEAWSLLQSARDVLRRDEPVDAAAALRRIKAEIAAAEASGRRATVRSAATRRWPLAGGIVAAAVATAAVVFATHRPPSSAGGTQFVRSYATVTGQRAVVTLDDGTRVTLAPRTTLRLARFEGRARVVTLDGEAYFETARAEKAPLVVRTGAVSTRVLGTAFDVRAYRSDGRVRVAVRSGKVSVASDHPGVGSVTLTAGRIADVTDSTVAAAAPTDMGPYTGWLAGRLVFNGVPSAEVLAALGRWYGYEFKFADPSLARKKLTASLSTESSAAALSTLKIVLDVDMAFDGNVVTLTPRREANQAPTDARRESWKSLSTHTSEVGR